MQMLSIEVVKTRYCSSFTKPNYGNNALSSPACCLTYFGWIDNRTVQYSTMDLLWQCLYKMWCCAVTIVSRLVMVTSLSWTLNTQCSQCSVYNICTLNLYNIHYEVSIQRAELSWQYKWNLYLVQLLCSLTDRTGAGAGALTGQYSRAITVVHCYEAAAVMKYWYVNCIAL